MANIKLIPSSYYLSSSSYLSVSNAANMYADTDSETYATVTNNRSSTSSYYIYLRGFNFEDIPAQAVVSGFVIRLKARESGVSTSTSYKPYLAHGTSAINGTCDPITTTAQVLEFDGLSADWADIVAYGEDFGIRINCRRANRNTTGYVYIYGAEIEVTYTIPDPRTVTSSLTGNGTISPSGAVTTYDGEEYELAITPADVSDPVTITHNGTDVTAQLVAHGTETSATFTAADVTTSGIQSGSSYAEYAVGRSAEDPASSSNNMYASSSSVGHADYSFDLSEIPAGAEITGITAEVYGHRESNTISSTYVSRCTLVCGGAISEEVDFPSTSNHLITVTATELPTRAELNDLVLRHEVGYYGGLVLGITLTISYSTGSGALDHYTYTFTVTGNATIAVVIGAATQDKILFKDGSTWRQATKVYKKVNGSWVEQTDLTNVFMFGGKYVKGS